MITIVTVWLCLITHVACDVVINVSNNGSDHDKCCVNRTCPCSSLSSALRDVSDNTVINITSESVTLHDIVGMGSGNLNNITITGNGATIMCNNTGGVYCESCSDITIMGITWYQCGHNDSALSFTNSSSDILIQDCTFQNCPVYIWKGKGNIFIKGSNFMVDNFNFTGNYSTGLYISYDIKITVAINNSKFDANGCHFNIFTGCYCIGAVIRSNNDDFECNQFLIENTNFSNYFIGLSLAITTILKKPVIELLNLNVYNNDYGIEVLMEGGANDYAGNVIILSSTFINNNYLSIHADTVNISSTTLHDEYFFYAYILLMYQQLVL